MREKALQFIGTEIQLYGHFEVYRIPYEDGRNISHENEVTEEEFLRLTYEYYTDNTRINHSYGDDLADQNKTKRFVKNRVNYQSEDIGKEWVKSHTFKN